MIIRELAILVHSAVKIKRILCFSKFTNDVTSPLLSRWKNMNHARSGIVQSQIVRIATLLLGYMIMAYKSAFCFVESSSSDQLHKHIT